MSVSNVRIKYMYDIANQAEGFKFGYLTHAVKN